MQSPFSDRTITVAELNATIGGCFESPVFHGLEVFGEVSGIRVVNGHAYFTLKDEKAEIACTCFGVARTYRPKDGESVILRGGLDYYQKKGKLSFVASTVTPVGAGALALRFERLKKQLAEEGLFDEKYKKPIPAYASDVLVVTSKTGAVIRDIVTTVRRKNPLINITVRDVRVQGEGAAREISSVLKRADALGYDVIVVARGGGSLEDLAPFYDEELVRTVFAMKTPVVSAIGHETDFSLLDFVADARAATPTAAGELVAYDYRALVDSLKRADERMLRSVRTMYSGKRNRLRAACIKVSADASSLYDRRLNGVRRLAERARTLAEQKLQTATGRAEKAVGMLDVLSPLKILARGYFNVRAAGKTVTSVRSLKAGDEIEARGADGTVRACVTEIVPEKRK